MKALRTLLRHHQRLASVLIVFALFARVAIPSGFMPVATSHGVAVVICTGMEPSKTVMAMPGMPATRDQQKGSKAESPCAFAGLSAPSLAGADLVLLTAGIPFVLGGGVLPARPFRLPHLRMLWPPRRGPPAHA